MLIFTIRLSNVKSHELITIDQSPKWCSLFELLLPSNLQMFDIFTWNID